MDIIRDIDQVTDEWLEIRRGMITASNFSKVLSGGAGKTRKSYLYKVAAEIITGEIAESFTNSAMEWGTATEPQARAAFEFESMLEVEEVTFIKASEYVGCSPDGLVGDNGMIEIKCPKTETQIETFISGKVPSIHKAQIQGQLWTAERDHCYFVSFDPRINGKASYFCERVERDEEYIDNLSKEVELFTQELIKLVDILKG